MAINRIEIKNKGSSALEASRVISSGAVIVMGGTIDNNSASEQFIQFHNVTSVPADGEIPKFYLRVPAQTTIGFDWSPHGREFGIGCVVCNSSTLGTKTIGSADCWFDIQVTRQVYGS